MCYHKFNPCLTDFLFKYIKIALNVVISLAKTREFACENEEEHTFEHRTEEASSNYRFVKSVDRLIADF